MPEKKKDSETQKKPHIGERISVHTKAFGAEFKKQTLTAWMAAFGLVLALAWNSVFQSFFKSLTDKLVPDSTPILAPLLSAVLTTILVVVGIMVLNRWAKKE